MSKKEISSSSSSPMDNKFPVRKRTPSFSSSLLDAIYRSIDESNPDSCQGDEVFSQFQENTAIIKKERNYTRSVSVIRNDIFPDGGNDLTTRRRAILIENWMEKQNNSHSDSTSSSESSSVGGSRGGGGGCGGGCRGGGSMFTSSSETESNSRENPRRKSSGLIEKTSRQVSDKQQKLKFEGGFSRTKLKAMKIYGELKKVKQPISPGNRIASFLNSIFSSGNGKKVKICSIGAMNDVTTTTTTTERKLKSSFASATSFSRSCLSKTPPPTSRGKSSNETKRSVRFYPVSIIVGEDSRPCGHKSIYEDDPGLMPMPVSEKFARSCSYKENPDRGEKYIRSYQKKHIREFDFRAFQGYFQDHYHDRDEDSDEEDDDDESCSSSDLFELDHLMGIGGYREELPVYETTNLKKNQAIANSLIL